VSKTTFLALCAAAAVGVGRLPAASAGARAETRALRPADQELARRILADARMDKVRAMGLELLRSGLNAGSGYAEVWIRDLNTFLVPALEANPPKTVREALLSFLHFQGPEGDIPDGYVPASQAAVAYRYRTSPTRPELRAHKNTVETDQESSFVQALASYVRAAGDPQILEERVRGRSVRERAVFALEYLFKRRFDARRGLIWGATTADWGDVQPETPWGVEFDEHSHRAIDIYDNAMLLIAIDDLVQVVLEGRPALQKQWTRRRTELARAVRKHLWDARRAKFIPHIYLEGSPFPASFDENRIFYHGGTAVAVEAGLLSKEETLTAYGQMLADARLAGAASIGLTLYPAYPEGFFKNPSMKPFSYQNGGDWTWFGARMVRGLVQMGLAPEACRALDPMLDRVLKHKGFYEWWSSDNRPRGSGKYRGSAGTLIEAIDALRRWAKGVASDPAAR